MSDVLEKVITTTSIAAGGGGLLKPAQANRFIDYMFDSTVLGRDARTERVVGDTAELDKMYIGQRLLRPATEAVDDHVNVGVAFSKISVTTAKLRLDWELSRESLEDNIEGAALEDHIARMMAIQVGNDLEDMAINGDSESSDPFLRNFDGWRKMALNGAHVVDAGGRELDRIVFNQAVKEMPRRYMQRRGQLRFYAGAALIQDYLFKLAMNGPEQLQMAALQGQQPAPGVVGGTYPFAFGIPVVEVPMFDTTLAGDYDTDTGTAGTQLPPADRMHGELELTFPKNRVWAVKREIEVFREFKPKKDSIEYTVFLRAATNIEDLDAYVVVRNVRVTDDWDDGA